MSYEEVIKNAFTCSQPVMFLFYYPGFQCRKKGRKIGLKRLVHELHNFWCNVNRTDSLVTLHNMFTVK